MRTRALFGFVLAGLVLLAPPVGAADTPASKDSDPATPFKPAVLVRIKALDELIADARYLVKQADREEEAKQIEKMLKARTGPKGLEGVDTKKAIGLYGEIAPRIDESKVVLLLPIADEETFLKFLDTMDFKPEKDKTGLYTLTVENIPFPLQFRFANGYLYGAIKFSEKPVLPAKDKLPQPATVLAGGSGVLSVTGNIDQIPMQIRKLGVSASALTLGNMKEDKLPGETDAGQALRGAILDEAAAQVKSLLLDGTAVMLKLDVDRKSHDLSVSFSLEGKNGSTLAKNIAALATAKSIAAGLAGSESAMGAYLHASLPENVRKLLDPVIDEVIKKALENIGEQERQLLSPLAEALKPTAKNGVTDLGLSLRGPGKGGKFTLVGSMQVKDGKEIDKALQTLVEKLPEDAKKQLKMDVAKAEGVSIHRIDPEKVEPVAKELFGEGPLFFAIRNDALIYTTGEKALETLKTALAVKPATGKPLQLDLSLARIAGLLGAQNKAAPEAAKKAFKEKDSDKVRLSIDVGSKLEVKLSVQSAFLTFAGLMDKARREAEKDQ